MTAFAAAHADIVALGPERKFVRRRSPNANKVALISGGGSGHEPLHAGLVGLGMLDAACPGQIFTSPTPDQIVEAATAVGGKAGVLFIVKNYAGDCMNFEMAAEVFEGPAATIVTNDDVAVEKSTYSTGRRGVAGTLVVEKIVGAAAEKGMDLKSCAELGVEVNAKDTIARRRVDELHCSGSGNAHVHARLRRDGNGRRHPRRARTPAGKIG